MEAFCIWCRYSCAQSGADKLSAMFSCILYIVGNGGFPRTGENLPVPPVFSLTGLDQGFWHYPSHGYVSTHVSGYDVAERQQPFALAFAVFVLDGFFVVLVQTIQESHIQAFLVFAHVVSKDEAAFCS